MSDFTDFDAYCDEREAKGDKTPVHIMFGEWLADTTGNAVIGAPVGEAPEFVAVPTTDGGEGE